MQILATTKFYEQNLLNFSVPLFWLSKPQFFALLTHVHNAYRAYKRAFRGHIELGPRGPKIGGVEDPNFSRIMCSV